MVKSKEDLRGKVTRLEDEVTSLKRELKVVNEDRASQFTELRVAEHERDKAEEEKDRAESDLGGVTEYVGCLSEIILEISRFGREQDTVIGQDGINVTLQKIQVDDLEYLESALMEAGANG